MATILKEGLTFDDVLLVPKNQRYYQRMLIQEHT